MHLFQSAGLAALVFALSLSACSPGAAPPASSSAPAAASEPASVAVAQAGGPPPACSTGRTKAVTNVCDDANPALFRAINADHKLLSPKCVWVTEQLMLSEREVLAFRVQDCSAEGWDGEAYAYAGGKVKAGAASTPYAIDRVVLEILDLGAGQSAQQVAVNTLATAPDTERARCIIRPIEDAPMGGVTFQLAPDDAFMAELDQAGHTGRVCGDYGVGDGVQLFEQRGGGKLFFHHLGQADGYWDPASFTFYRPDATGAWTKSPD
jgi:hypothetical protein